MRNRVKQYNNGYLPQSLGFFGSKDNFEWKQYTLDENYLYTKQETFLQCPLTISKGNPNV